MTDLKQKLTEEQYRVTQEKATEAPFSGEYYKHDEDGMYKCIVCEAPLFSSETKFDSGCGWPSFYEQVDKDSIDLLKDSSHGMIRTEIVCKKCGAHLGHLFDDGPTETGKRFCVNSASLGFETQK